MNEPFVDLKIHQEVAWSYIGVVAYGADSVVLATLLLYHGRKIYQDLFTEQRASIKHRRAPPVKTTFYKLALALCWFSVLFYWIADTTMVFTYFMSSDYDCIVQQKVSGITYHIAKTLMYVLFLVRLYMVYKTSAYAYQSKCIVTMCVIVVCYGLVVMTSIAVFFDSRVYAFDDIDQYPNYCEAALDRVTMALISLEDMVVSAGFMAAFYIPLRKTIKAVSQSVKNVFSPQQKSLFKIKYAGTKHTIITAVTIVSTFALLTGTMATHLNFIIGFDPIVNSICMVLMTPYYKDDVFYQRLCKCCLLCVSKKQASYKHARTAHIARNTASTDFEVTEDPTDDPVDDTESSAATTNTLSGSSAATATSSVKTGTQTAISLGVNSVDTMDQIQHTAAEVNPSTPPPQPINEPLEEEDEQP